MPFSYIKVSLDRNGYTKDLLSVHYESLYHPLDKLQLVLKEGLKEKRGEEEESVEGGKGAHKVDLHHWVLEPGSRVTTKFEGPIQILQRLN